MQNCSSCIANKIWTRLVIGNSLFPLQRRQMYIQQSSGFLSKSWPCFHDKAYWSKLQVVFSSCQNQHSCGAIISLSSNTLFQSSRKHWTHSSLFYLLIHRFICFHFFSVVHVQALFKSWIKKLSKSSTWMPSTFFLLSLGNLLVYLYFVKLLRLPSITIHFYYVRYNLERIAPYKM